MSYGLESYAKTKLATVTGIDAKAVAITDLYTVPAGKSCIVQALIFRTTAFTAGSKTIQAICNVGSNASNYDDQVNAKTVTFSAVNKAQKSEPGATETTIVPAGTTIKLNITTGSNATTETWAIDLFGYLV